MSKYILILLLFFTVTTCYSTNRDYTKRIKIGAENIDDYIHLIENKNVAVMANQSSLVEQTHLIDTLLSLNIHIKKIFSPEHGFRGKGDRGEFINNSVDPETGIPIISLYAGNHTPTKEQMKDVEVILFDLQDVGVRFFTYISSLHYVMESCAEYNVKLIILDRPNPNGFYVDGPVLDMKNQSFVGIYPIPIVYGMTMGEIANMALGEEWVCKNKNLDISIIKCSHYDHNCMYRLPVKPSPNLPNMRSIYLYPSLCLFEGTVISVGRGTYDPFQMYGHPDLKVYDTIFIPESIEGASKNPVLKGEKCYGMSLKKLPVEKIRIFTLQYLLDAYNQINDQNNFFTSYFTLLAGNEQLQKDIVSGKSMEEIKLSWQPELKKFMEKRNRYLLYPDFNH